MIMLIHDDVAFVVIGVYLITQFVEQYYEAHVQSLILGPTLYVFLFSVINVSDF